MLEHQRHRLALRGDLLLFRGELSPSGALGIEQRFPTENTAPRHQLVARHADFLVVVKFVGYVALLQPVQGFFHGVAVFDAVDASGQRCAWGKVGHVGFLIPAGNGRGKSYHCHPQPKWCPGQASLAVPQV